VLTGTAILGGAAAENANHHPPLCSEARNERNGKTVGCMALLAKKSHSIEFCGKILVCYFVGSQKLPVMINNDSKFKVSSK